MGLALVCILYAALLHIYGHVPLRNIYTIFINVKSIYPVAPVDNLVVTVRLVLAPVCGM